MARQWAGAAHEMLRGVTFGWFRGIVQVAGAIPGDVACTNCGRPASGSGLWRSQPGGATSRITRIVEMSVPGVAAAQ